MANQLWAPGTNGFITTPFAVLTGELNSLANGNTALSSVGGTSGVFTQSDTASGVWGQVSFYAGGAVTPSSGGYLAGWWVTKDDNSGYQLTVSNADQARAPDFRIPLLNTAYASGNLSGVLVRLPAPDFKVLLRNVSGVALPSSGNKIMVGPVALAL